MCTLMVGVATCVCSTCDCWTWVLMGMLGMWCCCCCRSPPAPNWCIGPRGRSTRGRAWCSPHLVDDLQDVVATLCLLLDGIYWWVVGQSRLLLCTFWNSRWLITTWRASPSSTPSSFQSWRQAQRLRSLLSWCLPRNVDPGSLIIFRPHRTRQRSTCHKSQLSELKGLVPWGWASEVKPPSGTRDSNVASGTTEGEALVPR